MTRLERCEYAIEQGYTYDPVTGKVYSCFGREMIGKTKGYLTIQLYKNKKKYVIKQHQFAWYYVNKEVVDCIDHINGNKIDNRIVNLRSVTIQENNFNRNFRGYHWDKSRSKWIAIIMINGKSKNLGRYNTEEEARESYLQGKEIYHSILSV